MSMLSALWLFVMYWTVSGQQRRSNMVDSNELYLGVFISQNSDFDFSGFIPTLNLGIQTINNSTDVLNGETGKIFIRTVINNSMCEASSSLRSFIDQIFDDGRTRIMLIGSDCSVSTEPIADLSRYWNLVQISPSSSSPYLSNVNAFPKFLRTVSSDSEIAIGISQVMKQFGWSRVSLLTQSENIFTFFSTDLKAHLLLANYKLVDDFTFNTNNSESMKQAFDAYRRSTARIVFLNMYEENAAEVICMAYKNGMTYPSYVWMVHNWYNEDWWLSNKVSCTPSQMLEVLRLQLVFDHFPRILDEDRDRQNIGGVTWHDYEEFYDEEFQRLNFSNSTPRTLEDGAYMFDTVWAAVLALNSTASKLPKNQTLFDFNYQNAYISQLIYEEALKVKFFGLTGEVYFDENGDRPGKIRLLQYRSECKTGSANPAGLTKCQFGKIEDGKLIYLLGESPNTVYQGEVPVDEDYILISLPLFIIYTIFSFLGIIFACICVVFNIWFKEQKLVKLSSPYVNIMIIAGAIIFYVVVILFGVDENIASHSTVDSLCQTRIWLVVIGFSLLFGTIFAKTWRIYYIFNHFKPNSIVEITDLYLFGIVGILLILDIVFLLPITIIDSAILRLDEHEISGSNDGDLPQLVGVCSSSSSVQWLPVLFACKGLVLLVGLFLAFETRKVKIPSLNESRFIGMSVYGAVVVSIALTPIGFLLENFPTVQYGIVGIMILASVTMILGLLFVTKMYKVYKDPEGKLILPSPPRTITISVPSEEMYKAQIEKLNGEVHSLRKDLFEISGKPFIASDNSNMTQTIDNGKV